MKCSWCGRNNTANRETCSGCGGVLPPAPPSETGYSASRRSGPAAVPPPPRQLPGNFALRRFFSSVTAVLGIVFSATGIPFMIAFQAAWRASKIEAFQYLGWLLGGGFTLLGLSLLAAAWLKLRRRLSALRHGLATEGSITSVEENYMVRVNGRHPWVVSYRFNAGAREMSGEVRTLNSAARNYQPGDRLKIVYLSEDSEVNSIWPPL